MKQGEIGGPISSGCNGVVLGRYLIRSGGFVELIAEKSPVPEPATLLVLIPGLLAAAYGMRRHLLQ